MPGPEHYLAEGIWHHNTGKSRACLEKLHLAMQNHAGARGLIARKTRASVTESSLVTWETKVVPADHPMFRPPVKRRVRQSYTYPNGSEVIVAGLDNPERIKSTEYDLAYLPEITECDENDVEIVTTRLRNGKMPYQQLIADCNPGAPTNWIKQRGNAGSIQLLPSRHEDNPELWDAAAGTWTPRGVQYIAVLDALTGVRKARLRDGLWAAAEGLVYDGWDAAKHLINPFPIPLSWPRYWVVDFGYTNPFCWQAWAEDPDGRLYRYREIYRTQTLVEDHATAIRDLTAGEPRPRAIICDHDAEDRATLERKLGLQTLPAHKDVSPGIQALAARLRKAGDGRPRLFLLRDALVARDSLLANQHKPCCTEEEVEGYIWDTSNNQRRGEAPWKHDDHGVDCARYLVAYFDLKRPTKGAWL